VISRSECTREHRAPAGPNEDIGQCPDCWAPTFWPRPENEQFGLHRHDCSLELRHPGECVGGGSGHVPVEIVRGYWGPNTERDIEAARKLHEKE
jgi:hypothetical protein